LVPLKIAARKQPAAISRFIRIFLVGFKKEIQLPFFIKALETITNRMESFLSPFRFGRVRTTIAMGGKRKLPAKTIEFSHKRRVRMLELADALV